MSEPITFLAALSGQNSAARWLSVDSEGAAKVVLETSSTELGNVMKLATLAKSTFRVTIQAE